MRKPDRPILRTTAEERRLIEELTSRPVSERLAAGEIEIVDPDDWSDVPVLPDEHTLVVPKRVFRALEAASRKRHTTPRRLALRLLREGLLEKKTG